MKILILVLLAFAIATAEANRGATFSEECKVTFEKFENETEISDVIKQNTFKNTGINLNDMEKTVREKIKNNYFSCIYLLMTRGFYQATQKLNDEILVPLDLDASEYVKRIGDQIKKDIDSLLHHATSRKKAQTVTPVFQWAQEYDRIFIQIKFAHRWDSPGCIEVKDEKVEITNNSLYFSAYGVQAGQAIQFILDVTFFKELKADEATWKMESVGRLYVEIPKAERGLWMRLLKSKEKHPTLRIWWDMKDQHEKAMEEFGRMLEQKEEREEKKKKPKKGKKKKKVEEEEEDEDYKITGAPKSFNSKDIMDQCKPDANGYIKECKIAKNTVLEVDGVLIFEGDKGANGKSVSKRQKFY